MQSIECICPDGMRSTHCDIHGSCTCCHGATCPQHDEPEKIIKNCTDEEIVKESLKRIIPRIKRELPVFKNGDVVLTHLLKKVNADTTANVSFERIEEEIRQLAYRKWEEDERPFGNGSLYWELAEKELFGPDPLTDGGYHIFMRNDGGNWVECIVRPL